MSISENQDQSPRLPFLVRALGYVDEDFQEPASTHASPDRPSSPCAIAIGHSHVHSDYTTTELAELTSPSIPTHYARILSIAFPWEKINTLVKEQYEKGEINDWELEEWEWLYKLHALSGSNSEAFEEEELAMRAVMNDVLLWGLAVDSMTGAVEEMEGVLDGFGWEGCVLWFEDLGVTFGKK